MALLGVGPMEDQVTGGGVGRWGCSAMGRRFTETIGTGRDGEEAGTGVLV